MLVPLSTEQFLRTFSQSVRPSAVVLTLAGLTTELSGADEVLVVIFIPRDPPALIRLP